MNRWLVVSIGMAALALAGSLVVFYGLHNRMPDEVPIHWNAQGKPDGFVPRDRVLPYFLILPGFLAFWVVLTLVLPWLSPRKFEVDRFRDTYYYIMSLCSLLFAYLQAVTLLAALQVPLDFNRVFVGGMMLGMAALGNVLGKVQRNFWIGVRTPWTLASETVWIRTHRLAAWCFVGGGLAGFVLVMLGVNAVIAMSAFGVLAIVPVFYSLVLYKQLEKQGRLGGPLE